jgi:AraC family L-rhamnose operon transcriptional activator RhaR
MPRTRSSSSSNRTPSRAADARPEPFRQPFRQKFFELDRLHVSVRLGSSRADFLYWGVLGEKWWRNYLHAHSFFEICYAFAGQGTFRMLGKDYEVKTGDLFVARPGETHEIVSSRVKPLGIYFWAFTLVRQPLSPEAAAPVPPANDLDRPVDALLDALVTSKRFIARPIGPTVHRTLELINEEIAAKPPGFTQSIHALTVKLLLDSARAVSDGGVASEELDAPVRSTTQAVVRTASRYLRDNLSRPIEVRDVAAQVHLSARHLSRLFHKETGTSILDYLTNLRIETAGQLLLDQELSIKQVARAVGYPDPHYFTTLFGRRTGMTPAVFRSKGGTKFNDEAKRPKAPG